VPRIFGLCGITISSLLQSAASAQVSVCRVADPTDTPLNVRTVPGDGKIVDTLRNGTPVTILDTRNKWAYIGSLPEEDEAAVGDKIVIPSGWVYREYLYCTRHEMRSDPNSWLIVKDVAANTCMVTAKNAR
jgi:Bacterial SH3 domain